MSEITHHLLRQAAEGDIIALRTLISFSKRKGDRETMLLCKIHAENILSKVESDYERISQQLTEIRQVLVDTEEKESLIILSYQNKIELIKALRTARVSTPMSLKEAKEISDRPLPFKVEFEEKGSRGKFLLHIMELPPHSAISVKIDQL